MPAFKDKNGPRALVAGGAFGIGVAYFRYAAVQGVNVIAVTNFLGGPPREQGID